MQNLQRECSQSQPEPIVDPGCQTAHFASRNCTGVGWGRGRRRRAIWRAVMVAIGLRDDREFGPANWS